MNTPNPNPSAELLQRARQIVADAKYDDPMFHALVMDGSLDFEMVDFVLAGMAEPQALPATGEVEDAVQSIAAATGGKCWEDAGAVEALRIAFKAGRESVSQTQEGGQ